MRRSTDAELRVGLGGRSGGGRRAGAGAVAGAGACAAAVPAASGAVPSAPGPKLARGAQVGLPHDEVLLGISAYGVS